MDTLPWYRQFWPWFLFGLPAVVVVAGLTTWWIAARNADHLVAVDYYKQGLAINREMRKQERASELGIIADLELLPGLVQVKLLGREQPAALQIYFSHPLDATRDFELRLARVQPGTYQAQLQEPLEYRWLWRIEPLGSAKQEPWRIDGDIDVDER